MKKISLITPLYNTSKIYLEHILQQIMLYKEDIEWILVNDSPLNSSLSDYINELDCNYEFITVYSNKRNMGIYKSYVAGLEKASGQFCGILDHDDELDLFDILNFIKKNTEFDILFTNEYKFNDNHQKFDYYSKPDFDFLSIVFYFYTHHITLFRTSIVKKILREHDTNKYSSIFDVCLMLNYLLEYRNKKNLKFVLLDSYSYGWRVHQNSTSLNINQKPVAYIERIMKIEEFFEEFEETALVSIDNHIHYLVNARFFSGYDLFGIPITSDKTDIQNWVSSLQYNNKIELKGELSEGYEEVFDILKTVQRVPFRYIDEYINEPIFIIAKSDHYVIESDENYKRHLNNVPFIIKRKLAFINDNKIKGLLIKQNDSKTLRENSLINIIVLK